MLLVLNTMLVGPIYYILRFGKCQATFPNGKDLQMHNDIEIVKTLGISAERKVKYCQPLQ